MLGLAILYFGYTIGLNRLNKYVTNVLRLRGDNLISVFWRNTYRYISDNKDIKYFLITGRKIYTLIASPWISVFEFILTIRSNQTFRT